MTNRIRLAYEAAAAEAALARAQAHMRDHEPTPGTMVDLGDVIEMSLLAVKLEWLDEMPIDEAREVLARIHALALKVLPVQGGVN